MKKQEPINVALPNTTEEKMKAIVSLSKAVENISKALISVQVEIKISNNKIYGAETAINIDKESA